MLISFESFWHDLRFAFRQLLHSPGFAASAILLLALGIGINAAIFSVIDSVLLRPLPLPDPDRLVIMLETEPAGCCSPPSWLDQRDIREQTRAFASIAAFDYRSGVVLRLRDRAQRLTGGYVTPDYFRAVGVKPVRGRVFHRDEAIAGRDNVVLLREDFWRTELGADPDILSKTLVVNGRPCNVIGMMPSWFRLPWDESVIWAPLVPTGDVAKDRGWHGFPLIGRLKPGVTFEQAEADFNGAMHRLARQYPKEDGERGGTLFHLRSWGLDNVRDRLIVLQIAALSLFLMACANVASLLLARYSARRREFAIRGALGASRWRQVWQHLDESLLLMALGAIAASAVAWASVRFLIWLYGSMIPRANEVAPDWRLIGVSLGIAILGGIGVGVTTAFHENKNELETSLRESNRAAGSRRSAKLRRALVILQVACAVALLGGAGELLESVHTLLHVDVGFEKDHLLACHVQIPDTKYKTPAAIGNFFEHAAARVRGIPGIDGAAAINLMPVAEMGFNGDVEVQNLPPHSTSFYAEYRWITADYFQTMHIPLLRGRLFLPEEIAGKIPAVIINSTMARRLWGTKDPIGSHLAGPTDKWATVVGISRDERQSGVERAPLPEIYVPAALWSAPMTSWSVLVRSRLPEATVAPAMRRAIHSLDPDAVVYDVNMMENVIAGSFSFSRVIASLLLSFSALALLLAALGIYGVVSYLVNERTPELAIRAALGAEPKNIMHLVARQGLSLVIIGIALGAAALAPLNSALAKFLYGVSHLNGWIFFGVLLILLVSGAAAVFLPVMRAVRIDPVQVLRQE